jgi:hypothetical protein
VITAAAAAGACASVSTEPGAIVALGFDTSTVAAVAGDTLRDTLGRPLLLRAAAFNARGDTVRGATLSCVASPADTGVIRVADRYVIGVGVSAAAGRVFASAGNLQSLPKNVDVIRVPSAIVRLTAADSAPYTAPAQSEAGIPPAAISLCGVALVQVTADSSGTAVGIRRVVVRFAVEDSAPAIADSVRLLDERTANFSVTPPFVPVSPLDTTNAGNAGRRVLVYLKVGAAARDTVVLRATFAYPAMFRGAALADDTVRIAIPVVPRPR